MYNKIIFYGLLILLLFKTDFAKAQTQDEKKVLHDFELEVEAEYRYFYDEALFEGQESNFPSIAFMGISVKSTPSKQPEFTPSISSLRLV